MNCRRDFVVIMARGQSLRMGRPKGLVRLAALDGGMMVQAVMDLYSSGQMRGVVLTTEGLVAAYEAVLPRESGFTVVGVAAGGETAQTLWYAARSAPEQTTHLWMHPVDLPLVAPETVVLLRRLSAERPAVVVRPMHEGVPGHPVIVPVSGMPALEAIGLGAEGSAASAMAAAVSLGRLDEPALLPVADQGVVMDFDCPADLGQTAGDGPREGNHETA